MINGKKGDGVVPAADASKNSGIPARVWAVLIAVCVVNVVGHLAVLSSLPAQIPVHWGADGAVNGWGPSWTVVALGFLPLAMLAMFGWSRASTLRARRTPSPADSTLGSLLRSRCSCAG